MRDNVGAQQFFADGSYGITRYKTDVADDTHQYSFDAGVNWQVTSRCSGRLVAAANQYQSPIDEQVGPGINTVTLNSFNETGKCLLTGYISAVLDSGLSNTTNSNIANALNDYTAKFVRGGFEYAVTGFDLVSLLTTVTQRDFTNRGNLVVVGLANQTTQIDYQLQYNKIFSPRFSFNGMVGITQISIMSADLVDNSERSSTPVYSASLTYQATPKLTFGVATASLDQWARQQALFPMRKSILLKAQPWVTRFLRKWTSRRALRDRLQPVET